MFALPEKNKVEKQDWANPRGKKRHLEKVERVSYLL